MKIVLFTRQGCHLCEAALDILAAVTPPENAEIVVRDVDGEPDLRRAYGDRVPVLTVDGAVALEGRFDEADVVRMLGALRDRA